MSTTIQLVNESKLVTPAQASLLAAGMQRYGNLVAQSWGLGPVYVTTVNTPKAWQFHIVDTLPAGLPEVLGIHQLVGDKVIGYACTALTMGHGPFGMVMPGVPAVGTAPAIPPTAQPGSLSQVLTHELAEALLDPTIDRYAFNPADQSMWLVEIADHADAYCFPINLQLMSGPTRPDFPLQMVCADFVLPAFYDPQSAGPFSHTGRVSKGFHLDPGCYGYHYQVAGGLSQILVQP